MSPIGCSRLLPTRFRLVLSSFLQQPGPPFADALTEASVQAAFDQAEASRVDDEDAVYTPSITLWAFLSQVLFKDEQRSCLAAVARVAVLLVGLGHKPCAGNSGAYCRARSRLPEAALRRLTVDVAEGCERQADTEWRWHDRHVKLVDGTPEYLQSPWFKADALTWLVRQGTVLFGVDAAGVEELSSTTHESHYALFDHNVALIENLTNLDRLGNRKTFTSVCTPIAVKGLEAFPVRVLGILDHGTL